MGLTKELYVLVGLLVIVSISASYIREEDPCYVEHYGEPQRDLIVGTRQPGDYESSTIHERYPANQYIPAWTQIIASRGYIFTYIEALNVGSPGNGQKITIRYGGANCTSTWFDFHFNSTEDYNYDIKMWMKRVSGEETGEKPTLTKLNN